MAGLLTQLGLLALEPGSENLAMVVALRLPDRAQPWHLQVPTGSGCRIFAETWHQPMLQSPRYRSR